MADENKQEEQHELDPEELEAQEGEPLPDREAMTVVAIPDPWTRDPLPE